MSSPKDWRTFVLQLKKIKHSHKITNVALAGTMCIKPPHLTRFFKAETEPSISLVLSVIDALELQIVLKSKNL